MKILVTDALGHISSALIRELPAQIKGLKEIVMIDNLSSQRFSSLFDLPKDIKYTFLEGDIRTLNLNSIVSKVDYVIHLAAITDAAGSFGNAEEVESNNYDCTLSIATACLEYNKKLITLSSTSVYGTQANVVTEDCSLDELNPQSPYATTKLREEKLVQDLHKDGLQVICFRFGTIFGQSIGMRFHTAVNKFCWQAAFGNPITVWSSAYDQKRPYLDLNDAIRSFVHVINKDLFNGEVYNVLTQNLTVRNVTDEIAKFIPSLKIEFVDSAIMNQLSYDVANLKFIDTGFIFEGSIHESIKKTIETLPYK